jgi:transposase-like protein
VVATLKAGLDARKTRPLADLDVVYLFLDAIALRVRSAGKLVSLPVLGVVAVLADGQKQLVKLELAPDFIRSPVSRGRARKWIRETIG